MRRSIVRYGSVVLLVGLVAAGVVVIDPGARRGARAEGRPEGHIIGAAPDDSMIVLSLDRISGTVDTGGVSPKLAAQLLDPGTGSSSEIAGLFAGWLETRR